MGRIDSLMQQGIMPIPPDVGIGLLHRLVNQALPTPSVVVTGRFGNPPTLSMQQPELPLRRFLETPRVYYPGVELVVDVTLSQGTDLYLADHRFEGEAVFPGVMGLEADRPNRHDSNWQCDPPHLRRHPIQPTHYRPSRRPPDPPYRCLSARFRES